MDGNLNPLLIKEITIFKLTIYFNLCILNCIQEHELTVLKAEKITVLRSVPRD